MRVNLLGPFEVYAQDTCANTAPAAQKVRQILALLALNANRVVRSGQLVEELWEDNPPTSVSTALQTYICQIRKKFGLGSPRGDAARRLGAGPTLSTVDGGYQLTLPEDRVDAFRFEPLISRARQEFHAGDFLRARNSVVAAMALWRDSALVDVRKGSILESEALRLNELHNSARHLRIDADLHLGRHHELLSELTSLARLEPTNEGVQRHLMLALYRTDRRADALRAYQRARTSIADELGLDPSPELQALHTAILNSDDSLLGVPEPLRAVAATASPATQVPRHLPPARARLSGRRGQLARAVGALTAPAAGRVVVVNGPLASGKSELCVHAAQEASAHYPDGQLFARLLDGDNRPVDHATVLRSFLRGLGAPDDRLDRDVTDLSLMFRAWTADRRVLVVLDDVTSPDDLAPLLPSGKGCGTLISGRRRLFVASSTEQVELDRLPLDDSLQVLGAAVADHRITMDPEGVRHLAELCHGLPGALLAVASKLRLRPHWTARQAAHRIAESSEAGGDPLGIRSSLERSLTALSADARFAFDTLTATRGLRGLGVQTAASLLGTSAYRTEELLEELVETHLLRASLPSTGGRFSYTWEPALAVLRTRHSTPGVTGRVIPQAIPA
ncbi:BTAD domain-containing putative transcriptional regulator [Streptomyces iakyrus]|uniref:AfsR/SARP family transcriptional regulator n=1 Tax=Streptomyces iakyrus TaxID=68219 RepID=UPI00369F156B